MPLIYTKKADPAWMEGRLFVLHILAKINEIRDNQSNLPALCRRHTCVTCGRILNLG